MNLLNKNRNRYGYHIIWMLLLTLAMACTTEKPKKQISKNKATQQFQPIGNYVSNGYDLRNEGYDWTAIKVTKVKEEELKISIRSRADKKRPTCTFDTKAFKKNDTIYEAIYEGKKIIFQFTENNINISAEEAEVKNLLYFFCNGGASIEGTYKKIADELDQEQIDPTEFFKVLRLQGIGFTISSVKEDGKTLLSIFTFGLERREFNETLNLDGEKVIDAEVEDLNSDGSPELFIYTQSEGSGSYGHVYAFSVNNKQSMSQVYFQPTEENTSINKGYMGHDEFSVVETRLSQRFPIYKEGDSNANPTGGTRQITYRLIEGEAMRKLAVDKITEY